MKKLMLLLPLIVALSSCKKEDQNNNDILRIQSFCSDCTISIKSKNTGQVITKNFTESIVFDARYEDIMPFTGTVTLKSDKAGAFIISASVIDGSGATKNTFVLLDKKPSTINTEVQFNSDQISN